MSKIKKSEYFLLIIFGLFLALSVQGQTPEITLTWSTDTYVPLDYPGKALPTRSSSIEVVANIDSKTNPQNLIYNWFINGHIQDNKSGKGKQILKFNIGERLSQNYEIKVVVSDERGSFNIVSPYLIIKPKEPEIILESETQLIESSRPTKKYLISSNQKIEFTARPYFFNIDNVDDLTYNWDFGGERAVQTDNNNPNIFTLEISQLVESITRNLTVRAENKASFFQKAQSSAEINIIP